MIGVQSKENIENTNKCTKLAPLLFKGGAEGGGLVEYNVCINQ